MHQVTGHLKANHLPDSSPLPRCHRLPTAEKGASKHETKALYAPVLHSVWLEGNGRRRAPCKSRRFMQVIAISIICQAGPTVCTVQYRRLESRAVRSIHGRHSSACWMDLIGRRRRSTPFFLPEGCRQFGCSEH